MADGYISQIKTPDNKVYDFRDQHLKVYTGSCTTAAGTAIKDVTTDGEFTLAKGAVIFVNFSATNTAAVADLKLRVNSNAANDAKPIKHEYNASEANLPGAGYLRANQTYQFYYDGTNWVTDVGRDANSTYSYMRPYESTGKGSYNSQGENPAKTGAAGWRFQLSAGKYFMYSHYYDNTAKSALTLNIGSTGAKPIYINGQPSSSDNYTLPGGQYLVYYDGTNYYFRTDDKMTGNITGNAATATSSKVLVNQNGTYGTATTISNRVTDTNIVHVDNGGVTHFKVGTATNGPAGGGNILHFYWDTSEAWDAQLHIPNNSAYSMSWRASSAAGTWNSWKILLDTNNYTSYAVAKTAGVTAVTWDATNKKLTRTINGTAADVVTAAQISTALELGTIASKAENGYIKFGGDDTNLGSGSPASNAKTYWADTTKVSDNMITGYYNHSGTEYSLLFSKRSTYGSILKWGYGDRYLRILRIQGGTWKSTDWEKIDAGYADSADYATQLSFKNGRIASADLDISTMHSRMLLTLASNSMKTNKPPMGDGYIVTYGWDNAHWGAQQAISHTKTPHMTIRGTNGGSTSDWGDWIYLLDANNYADYTVTKTGSGASGTWDISITGTAAKATADASGNTITSTYATKTEIEGLLAVADAMIFRGVINATDALPNSHKTGDTYRVGTAGTYPIVDSNGRYCEIGTLIICTTEGTAANAAHWTAVETNEDGAVIGPSSSTDNAIARFDGATGRIIQNSGITINDNGNLVIAHGTNATMTAASTNPQIIFSENGSQPVHLIYSDYDSYRSPAGLKIIGGTSASPAWLEVEGNIYAAAFKGNADTASSAEKLTTARNLGVALGSTTAVTFDGSANQTSIPVSGTLDIEHGGTGQTTLTAARQQFSGPEFIVGTWTAASGTWTGTTTDSALYDGKQIILYMPFAGSGDATLNLTLADGTTTGAKNVYFESTTRFTTHKGQNAQLHLIYHSGLKLSNGTTYEGWWYIANRDTDNDYRTRQNVLADTDANNRSLLLSNPIVGTANNNTSYVTYRNDKIYANVNTGIITATGFNGDLTGDVTGNADTATAIQTAGTTAQFYRGDNSWSNIIKQTANATLGIDANLKIGTARKDLNFDINNGSGADINDGYAGGITWGHDTAAYAGIYYQSSSTYGSRLIFGTTGSYANGAYARMIIQNDGKIGIGTLTPSELLHVTGNLLLGNSGSKSIYYQGTKSKSAMITFLDNTSNTNGNGIKIGGGGAVAVGAGNSATDLSVTASSETLYLTSDGVINIEAGGDTIANRIGVQVTSAGHLIPVKAEAANNNAQNLGASDNTWAKLYIGTASSYGDAYTPIYWHEGVPTTVTLVQQCAFTINSGMSGVKLSHAAITANSYVTQIVVTSGEANLNSAISWTSAAGYIELTCSSTVSGDVTGYIMISRGGEITATATDIT